MSLKTTLRGIAVIVLVGLIAVGAWAAKLILPGLPSASKTLAFNGYLPLPAAKGKGLLSIMDYVSIHDRTLYVTGESSGTVYAVEMRDGAMPAGLPARALTGAPSPHGVVIDPVSRLGFVSRSEANTVDVFDPASLRTINHIAVGDDVDGIFYDPQNRLVYAVNGDPNMATLIDPATQTKVGTIALGGKPEFAAFDPATKTMLQNLNDKNAVAVVDLAKRAVIDRFALTGCEGPTGMALDDAARRLFVVCNKNATLVVADLNTRKVIQAVPIGGGPDAVAFDPEFHRLYATGKAGVLTVVHQDGPDRYSLVDSVKLHFGAHTLAVDPKTHQVFVAYASILVSPRLAVFTPRP